MKRFVIALTLSAASIPAIALAQPCDPNANDPIANLCSTIGALDPETPALVAEAARESNAAVAALRERIGTLSAEIARLESRNAASVAMADAKRREIEARKSEIEANYERTRTIGIIGILFGFPAVGAVSLVKMWEDDGRLQQLDRELASLTAERSRIGGELVAYKLEKREASTRLETLRGVEKGLLAGLEDPVAAESPIAAEKARLELRGKLVANLRAQIEVLKSLRSSAASLGVSLDGLIARLETSLARAEKLATDSDKSLFELVRLVTSPDPELAANGWLEDWRAAKTKEVLDSFGLDARLFVDRLVSRSFPEGGPAAGVLRGELLGRLRSAGIDAPGRGMTITSRGKIPIRVTINDGAVKKVQMLWKKPDGSTMTFDLTPRAPHEWITEVDMTAESPAGDRTLTITAFDESGAAIPVDERTFLYRPE